MGGNALVPLVMFGWIPLVLYLFTRYPPQKALVTGFVIAWLFLPVAEFKIPGIPGYNKMTAISYGILLATVIYDSPRLQTFKFHWVDIPMAVWLVCPFITSNVNGLGPYDGFSMMQSQIATWGLPYYLGRIYLNNLGGLRQLAIAIFMGGLAYVPLCWLESRIYTSLMGIIYGVSTGRDAAQSFRYGGYRPQLFMEHGLMLGVWMMTACLMGVALWKTGIIKRLWNQPMGVWMAILILTFIICRSTGAYVLFLVGVLALFLAWQFRTSIILWVLVLGIFYYLYLGVSGTFPNKQIVATMSQMFNADRVASVQFRFDNEEILGAKARQQMIFGWGGFGRSRVFNERGEDISVTDSLWIIVFGINGVVGLISVFSSLLLPVLSFCIRFPARLWSHPLFAPPAALAIGIAAYSLDCVLNAMVNPIFILASGGIAGIVAAKDKDLIKG